MMTTTTPKPREGQVAGFPKEQAVMLTESNAYRAKSIRRTGTDEAPVLFHFRKRCMGMHSYVHTIEAADGTEREIRPSDFKNWEITGCRYPGYLEDLYGSACSAYRWNSFDPEERAQTDICRHEEQLCADLTSIPEEKREQYKEGYRKHLAGLFGSLSRCASPAVTGPAGFDRRKQEKAEQACQNRQEEFENWRERFLAAMKRMQEEARPEEEKLEAAWKSLKRDIADSVRTIHELDTGKIRGYNRALFVSSILNKVMTYVNRGEVETVQKAVDFIRICNAGVKKPVITPRNRFFQFPEMAARLREKMQASREEENSEILFEGGRLVWNRQADRLQILFDGIPDDARRRELKSNGFRWSPKNKAWQRQLTMNAVRAAKRMLDLQDV